MIRAALPALAVFSFLFLTPVPAVAQEAVEETLVIATGSGKHEFTVELADTAAERAQGLMYRRSLAPDRGMLFDFETDQQVSMWMKNTYIPLDMIFIRADGTVHSIARDTTPLSTETVSSRGKVRAVLELAAGGAARIDLEPGDMVRHPIFGTD